MNKVVDEQVPTAYAAENGPPDGTALLPVYNPLADRYDDIEPYVVAYFLIDASLEQYLADIPHDRVWHILTERASTFATCWNQQNGTRKIFFLHEEIWKKVTRPTIPDGFHVVTANQDWYDCRASNLRLRRKVTLNELDARQRSATCQ
ncbi:MAG: hypothetical protein ABSC21_19485 [Terriglobia bacterium]|jgi:hypothetical protein